MMLEKRAVEDLATAEMIRLLSSDVRYGIDIGNEKFAEAARTSRQRFIDKLCEDKEIA